MNSIPCALVVALFVSLAIAAPTATTTTTVASSTNKTLLDSIGQTVTIGDLGQFVIVFGVSPCMSACMDNMTHAFNNTDTELDQHIDVKFQDICDIYFAAAACFRKCPNGDDHLFDVVSAGANYMCVEQRAAYERAMPCIRKEKKALKQECDKKCAAPQPHDGKRIEKVEKVEKKKGKSVHTTTPTTTTTTQSSNSSDSLAVIGGLCDVLHCSIECGRDFLNERCPKDLHAGNLLTELIIRPLEKNAEFLQEQMSPEEQMSLAQSLPKQCLFLGDEEQLNAFRGNWTLEDSKKENLHDSPAHPHKKAHSVHKSKTTTTTSTTKLPASKAATSTTKVSATSSTTSTTDIPSTTTKESRTRRPL